MEKIKRTNLERIRMMTAEELAEFLSPMDVDEADQGFCMKSGKCPHESACYDEAERNRICHYVAGKPLDQGQREIWGDWLAAEWEDAPAIPEDENNIRAKDLAAYVMRYDPGAGLHVIIADEGRGLFFPVKGAAIVTGADQPVILVSVDDPEPIPDVEETK